MSFIFALNIDDASDGCASPVILVVFPSGTCYISSMSLFFSVFTLVLSQIWTTSSENMPPDKGKIMITIKTILVVGVIGRNKALQT